jgi:hypothetical protein
MFNSRKISAIAFSCIAAACWSADLRVDHGMQKSISFEEFGLKFDLADKRTRFRLDGVVDDLDKHQQEIMVEFGLTKSPVIFKNPAFNGRTSRWQDRSGVTWIVSFSRSDSDQRIALARLTHEKYHALNVLSSKYTSALHSAVEARGFRIKWKQYDEEQRASIVEVASLFAQGIPLENLGGSELVVKALDILKSGRTEPKVRAAP